MKRLLIALLITLALSVPSFAALGSTVVWEVETGGADTQGGGFDPAISGAGTDMTQFANKNAASCTSCQSATVNISTTDAVTANTTTVTSATANFSSALIGNTVYLSGTATTTGWYEVTAVGSATSITVDRATGSTGGTGVTINIGGALASPGQAAGNKVAGNDIFIKSGTYSLTTATVKVAAGMVTDSTGGVDQTHFSHWVGYNTTRTYTNTDTKPLLQASGSISSFTILLTTAEFTDFENLSVDCASKTTSTGIAMTTNPYQHGSNLKAANCKVFGVNLADGGFPAVHYLEVSGGTGCTAGAYIGAEAVGQFVESHGNACPGIQVGAHGACSYCVSYANTGASSDGFQATSVGYYCTNCTSYNNGRAGFDLTGNAGFSVALINCIAEANAGVGYNTDGVKQGVQLINDSAYNNDSTTSLSGQYSTTNIGFVAGFINNTTGTFFVSASTGNFALNSTTNQGALLRNAAFPATFPAGTTASYNDIGISRHQDPSGSSATVGYPIQ